MIEILSRILKLAGSSGLIRVTRSKKNFNSIKNLQFANDILLFYAKKQESAMLVKAILQELESRSRKLQLLPPQWISIKALRITYLKLSLFDKKIQK